MIGAGALGLGAARRLASRGARVTVFEREAGPGGLAVGFRVGPSWLEKFYHHVFGTDRRLIDLIGELGLGADIHWARPPTSILHGGQIYRLDGPLEVLRFRPLPLADRLRLGAATAALKLLPNAASLEHQTAAAWLQRWMGPHAYRVVWEPLLRGKFGAEAERIAMSWFWARIHCRTPQLGYLRGGFQRMYEALAEELRNAGHELHFETTVTRLGIKQDGVVVETSRGQERFDALLCTLPTRLFLKLAEGLPDEYQQQYGHGGEHYSAHCVVLELDRPLQSSYWLNVADPGYPFLALVEHTNFLPPRDYGDHHLIYLGNYLPPNDELFRLEPDVVLARFLPSLARINPAFEPGWVQKAHVFQAPYAQPIVRVGYPGTLPPHRTPLPKVWLANMGHVYPQDRGQNYSVLLGERVAGELLGSL